MGRTANGLGLVLAAAAGFAAGAGWASRERSGAARPGGGLAHRADGSDDPGSLAAGIADEGLIPDDVSMADTMPGGLATVS